MELPNEPIFGTDGVRGRANSFPMTVEMALALGRAVGQTLYRPGRHARVAIGKDTRLSCYMFENALIAGLCSMGVDTLMLGPLPTPALAFITRAYRAAAGIMISASHNPYYDNGIKFFTEEGFKQPDEWEKGIEASIRRNDFTSVLPKEEELGKNSRVVDADGRYIEFVKATFPKKMTLSSMRIALDSANGAAWRVAPLIFKELDAQVHLVGHAPNGLNINVGCGSLHPEAIQQAVIARQADIGIALDGDADRVVMVDEQAQIVDGDVLLAICAADMQRRGVLRDQLVVSTVMSNLGFLQAMNQLGIGVLQTPVGDRYVLQEMIKSGAVLGGEQSGHLIFLDHNTTADGLVAALQVLRIMLETGSRLSDLRQLFHPYPQYSLSIPVSSKLPLEELERTRSCIAAMEKTLADKGRILLRYSGTEPLLRIMVEGPKQKLVVHYAEEIARTIQEELACLSPSNHPTGR